MATRVLPDSPAAFKDASWDDVLPYYEGLAERPLDNSNVEEWLADWSLFESLLSEAAALANFDYACDTSDPAREAAQLRFGPRSARALTSSASASNGGWSSSGTNGQASRQ